MTITLLTVWLVGLMSKVTVTKHPELVRIINPGEDLAQFLEACRYNCCLC
jgi:hypothetical protein